MARVLLLPWIQAVPVHEAVWMLQLGGGDPTYRRLPEGFVHATWTPEGPAVLRVQQRGEEVRVHLEGEGAPWVEPRVPGWLGLEDDPSGFAPEHPALRRLVARHGNLGLSRDLRPVMALMRVVLQQRVRFEDAVRSWRGLCRAHGVPVQVDGDWMLTAPVPESLAGVGYAQLHEHGIEQRRANLLRWLASRQARVDGLRELPPEEAVAWMLKVPGLGPWSANYLAGAALGHADAVITGDVHLPRTLAWVLERTSQADDADLIRRLEPYRPHRYRVIRLLLRSGILAPRRGPERHPGRPW